MSSEVYYSSGEEVKKGDICLFGDIPLAVTIADVSDDGLKYTTAFHTEPKELRFDTPDIFIKLRVGVYVTEIKFLYREEECTTLIQYLLDNQEEPKFEKLSDLIADKWK